MLSNGQLDTSTLVVGTGFSPIETGAGGLLLPEVAAQHNLMAIAFERDLGLPLIYSEGYRDLPRQNLKWSQYQHGGTLAAFPGTSTHGEAVTIDYASGVGYAGTAASTWMDANGPAYGFVADVPSERWHRHFACIPTITPAVPLSAADLEVIMSNADNYTMYRRKGSTQTVLVGGGKVTSLATTVGKRTGLGAPKTISVLQRDGVKLVDLEPRDFDERVIVWKTVG